MDAAAFQIPLNAPGVVAFNQQRDALWLLVQAVTFAAPFALVWSGLAARWRDRIARLAGGRPHPAWIMFVALFLMVWALAVAPFAYLMEVVHREAWGRPVDTLQIWAANRGLTLGGQILAAALVAAPLLWIQSRFHRTWWLILTGVVWLAVSAGLIIEQVWIRPALTPVAPLAAGPVKEKFDALTAKCMASPVPVSVGGIDLGGTVVGVGPLTRMYVAPQDLALAKKSPDGEAELIGTLAHELSHYVFHDTWLALWVGGVLMGSTALLTILLGRIAIAAGRTRIGFGDLRDPAAIPLVLALSVLIWTFAASPILLAVQRHIELRADKFAIELTRDNDARLRLWRRYAAENPLWVQDYYWFFETFRASHPSMADRVRLAMSYRPWETGDPQTMDEVCRRK
jgi:Zn-dependent protease with chaperone function